MDETYRIQPQSTQLHLSIFRPNVVLECQVTGTVSKGSRVIPFDTVSFGSHLDVEPGMTLWVGTVAGEKDLGKIRIKSITASQIVVSENSHINWVAGAYLTVLRYWEVWPVYPRIIPNPADDEDVIFYKDYDIAYTNQNTILGALVNAGSHKAGWAGDQLYFSASGTTHLVPGTSMTYDWAFEGGDVTGSTSHTPGYIQFDTPGHYVVRLIVTGDNGSVDTTYRYVSIYNKETDSPFSNPIRNWSVDGLSGSRGEGGNRTSITVTSEDAAIEDGSVVVLFAEDWYGGTQVSLGGNAVNGSKVFFSGHVLTSTIRYNYQSHSISFDIGNISEMMKLTETYAISLESAATATKWFQMEKINGKNAIYHYLKWHSTVLYLADFEFTGTDQNTQFFDTDRQSVFDAVDNYMRNALLGNFGSDRQGKLWAEVGTALYTSPTGSFPTVMGISRGDWMGEPNIVEALSDSTSFIELGGVAYSGVVTGSFSAHISQAPGATPYGRGKPDNITGLTISGQAHLNRTAGNLYATRNAKYPSIEMDMTCGVRNLDTYPFHAVGMDISASDVSQGVEIHAPYLVDNMEWKYDVKNRLLLPSIGFTALVDGTDGETITIPAIPDDGGFGDNGFGGFSGITLPALTFPTTLSPTYTWSIIIPAIGGIPGPRIYSSRNAMQIDAYCEGGTSVTFNIEIRSAIGTPGVTLSTSDIVATPTGVTGVVANPFLPAGSWLWLELIGVSGSVSKFVVTLAVV